MDTDHSYIVITHYFCCSSIKRLRVHMSVSHPDLPKEELDKLTGYKHKMQGKMGKWLLWGEANIGYVIVVMHTSTKCRAR